MTLVVITYGAVRAFWWASARVWHWTDLASAEALAKLLLWLPICFAAAWFLPAGPQRRPSGDLGLGRGVVRGLWFGLASTIPMAFVVALLSRSRVATDLVGSAVTGPLAEEVLFRGLLFRLLISRAGWTLPSALLLSSALFAFAHVPHIDGDLWTILRGPNPMGFEFGLRDGTLIHFVSGHDVWWRHATTTLSRLFSNGLPYMAGGAVFAWVTHRWNSLWPAIALHASMNLWWDLTQGEHSRLVFGADPMSVAQAGSAALAIAITLRWAPRREARREK